MKISVILPSLNPSDNLVKVVEGVKKEGFNDIIVINDGSAPEYVKYFEEAATFDGVTVLTHEVNRGKGAALKTAYVYCMKNRPDIDGVVTVDGDNQHLPKDIKNCCEAMLKNPDNVVLGVRQFDGPDVPKKSRYGNNITKFVFRAFCGIKLSDTQTGLRAIPASLLEFMANVSGERYEYETQVLLEMHAADIPFIEVPIDTVYIDDNSESHFHPVRDSFKIYKVIFKFMPKNTGFKYTVSSVLSWVIDNGIFNVLAFLLFGLEEGLRILICTVVARILSSIFNYTMNKKLVFKSSEKGIGTALRYYTLWFFQMLASYGLVFLFTHVLTLGLTGSGVSKVIVDLCLFLLSYQIQKRWVFAKKEVQE